MENLANRVEVVGKVCRLGVLKYTPAGVALRDFTVAVAQKFLDRPSIGYFEVQTTGRVAESDYGNNIRIGAELRLVGSLWGRTFRDRQGRQVSETKILADTIVALSGDPKDRAQQKA